MIADAHSVWRCQRDDFRRRGMKVKLTNARLKTAQEAVRALGVKSRVLFDDGPVRGFGVRVNHGCMLFFADYPHCGIKRRMAIGRAGEISIEQARKRAATIRLAATAGEDPLGAKRAAEIEARRARIGLTVSEAVADWITENTPEWSVSTRKAYASAMSRDVLPLIGTLPVRDLDRETLVALVTKVKARSTSSASMLLRVIKSWTSHLDSRGLVQVSLPKSSKVV